MAQQQNPKKRTLILASSSPYRRELLSRLTANFLTFSPDVDETPIEGESPRALVQRLSKAKAMAKLPPQILHTDTIVIGSDQVACCDNKILGKPLSINTARQQLLGFSKKEVIFYTGLCIYAEGQTYEYIDETKVVFQELSEAKIMAYLEREQPLNCAGSFKSEGLGICLFERIENCDPSALMGLPLIALNRILEQKLNFAFIDLKH